MANHRVPIFTRDETGAVYLPTQLECTVYTATLLVMVKGVGVYHPPSPAWANFTLMMECTPESSRCYSVNSVWLTVNLRPATSPALLVLAVVIQPTALS